MVATVGSLPKLTYLGQAGQGLWQIYSIKHRLSL